MQEVKFVDTTIRDGHQSLWAMNMRTSHMLGALQYLDSAGFEAIEFIAASASFKKLVRHLHENPWQWIKLGATAAKRTPLRWHGDFVGKTLSGYIPPEIGDLTTRMVADLGIRYTRIGNKWNNFSNMGPWIEHFESLGMTPIVNIIYSVSPRHTDEHFVERTRQVAALRPYRLCFKDVGGLLTPDRIRTLVPKLLEVSPGITWEFHGHCNNGFGPVNALEFAKLGISYIHTAIPPLANANSQPSIYNVAANLRTLGFDAKIDEEVLRPASEFLEKVARDENLQIGIPYEYDEKLYKHQVPGGMISNLRYQLALAGVEDRLDEVLEEIPQVRAELGYPVMVTPLSQIVGSQAAVNVITRDRYAQVTDQTIEYALGKYGSEATSLIDEKVLDRILNRPRSRELQTLEPWEPTISELRQKFGKDVSDEDLILMTVVGDDALDVVGAGKGGNEHVEKAAPLSEVIRQLLTRDKHSWISLSSNSLSLSMLRSDD